MKEQREALRRQYIEQGLIYDPSKPMRLEDAITFTGTCEDMCPEYERHQREFEKGLDKLEMVRNDFFSFFFFLFLFLSKIITVFDSSLSVLIFR